MIRMRSLFLKIFLWFWLAMALVVLAHSIAAMMVYDRGAKGFVGRQLELYALTAAETYERDGQAKTDAYLRLVERNGRARLHLFDTNGTQLAGRDATPPVRALAQTVVAGSEEGFEQTARTDFIAKRVYTPTGRLLIVVGEMQRPTGIRLPFMPGVWWAQLLAVLLTTGLLCYLLARYLSAPVVKLREATQRLAAGELSARVGAANHKRRDELADLGRDFDVMAERIEALLQSQQRLLHDISHELRSPLTRQKIALELAREGEGEEMQWALERIEREANRLNDLINQLLALARLESRLTVAEPLPVDLKHLIEEIISDADFEARNQERAVRLAASADCWLMGNESLLHSAIENVVRNAVLYTAAGTEVEVTLRREAIEQGAQAVIRVLDHGAGVPQAALANIFRPFYRVAEARDRASGGVGLGLSISQRAVAAHGGTVSASNAPDGGLAVEIVLPLGNP